MSDLEAENQRLRDENTRLRKAVVLLTDAFTPMFEALAAAMENTEMLQQEQEEKHE